MAEDYVLRVELDEFKKQMQEAVTQFKRVGDTAEKEGGKIDNALKKVGMAVGSYFAYAQVQAFIGKIIQTRAEIEKLQVSFRTLAGEDIGDKLFGDIKQFATTTPLLMKDLAGAAQTMLGFGIAAEQIMPNLKAIGDISMGDSQKLQSLSLAFSQMSATGKLMGQDLLQMINAGFNPLSEISRKTGKSIAELKDDMSKGAISAEMVRDAFISATQEGGKFNGMLEAQSKTISGAYSNLEGAIDDTFNRIGETMQPIVISSIEGLTELAKNFDEIGKYALVLAEVYGAWKAAELATLAITKAHTGAIILQTAAIKAQTVAQAALNAVMALNPYVAATMAIVALGAAVYTLSDRTSALEMAEERLQQRTQEITGVIDDKRKALEQLLAIVTDETKSDKERAEALEKLKRTEKELMGVEAQVFAKYDSYIDLTNQRAEAQKALNDELAREQEILGKKAAKSDKTILKQIDDAIKQYGTGAKYHLGDLYKKDTGKVASSYDEVERWMASVRARVKKQDAQASKDAQIEYTGSVQTKSVAVLKKEKAENERLLQMAKDQNKQYVRINGNLVSRAQLLERIKAAEEKINKASQKTKPYKEALDAYNKATKELANLRAKAKKEMNQEEKEALDSQIKVQEENLKKAKETLTSYGWKEPKAGATKTDTSDDVRARQARENRRQERDLELAFQQEALDLMDEGQQKKLAKIEYDFEVEKAKINDWYEDLILARVENERALWSAKGGIGTFKPSASTLAYTDEDVRNYEQKMNNAKESRLKALRELKQETDEQLSEYIMEFGTLDEKQAVITEKFTKMLAEAGDNEKLRQYIELKFKDALKNLNTEELSRQIDWEGIFGNLRGISQETLQMMKSQLQNLLNDPSLKPDQIKVITDRLQAIKEAEYGNKNAFTGLRDAVKDLRQAKDELNKLRSYNANNSGLAQLAAQLKEVKTQAEYDDIMLKKVNVTLADGSQKVMTYAKWMETLAKAEAKVASDNNMLNRQLKEVGKNMSSVSNIARNMSRAMGGNAALDGIANITQTLGDALSSLDFTKGAFTLGNIEQLTNVFSSVASYINALNANAAAERAERVNHLKEMNSNLKALFSRFLDDLKEELKTTTSGDYQAKVGEMKTNLQSQIQNIIQGTIKVMEADQKNWGRTDLSSGTHGQGEHLWKGDKYGQAHNPYINLKDPAEEFNKLYGTDIKSTYDILKLDYEMLKKFVEMYPKQVAQYSEFYNSITEILDLQKELSEVDKTAAETLLGTSVDAFYDEWVSLIQNMESTVDDFGKYFTKTLSNAILSDKLTKDYRDQLEKIYDTVYEKMTTGGITQEYIESARAEVNAIAEQMIDMRRQLQEMGLISDTSTNTSGSTRGIAGVTQDQASELNGRFAQLQMAGQSIANSILLNNAIMEEMAEGQRSIRTILTSYQDVLYIQNSNLREIADNTRRLAAIESELQQINDNTKNL